MKLWQQSVLEGRYVMSYQLSSTQWRQVESFLPGRPGWVGVTAKDNRTFVNGVPRQLYLPVGVNQFCRFTSLAWTRCWAALVR